MGEVDLSSPALIASAVLSALVGLPLVASKIMQTLRSDKNDSRQLDTAADLVESQNTVINNLNEQLDKRNKRIDELTDRVDKMATQRNDVMVENATLKATNSHLNEQLQNVLHQLKNANMKINILMERLPPKSGINPDATTQPDD